MGRTEFAGADRGSGSGLRRAGLLSGLLVLVMAGIAPAHASESTWPFTVWSPAIAADGNLAAASTCDGAGTAPIIRWSAPPKGTRSFLVLMSTEPGPPRPGEVAVSGGDYSWTRYNLPAKARSTAARGGETGHNSHNPELAYAPPCSQGPGEHVYTVTVYALSSSLTLPAAAATGDSLIAQASRSILAQAAIEGKVTRS